MEDQSHLDRKYFIDDHIYNCPFCNRRHVSYALRSITHFDWSNKKKSFAAFVVCNSCEKVSMHLSNDASLLAVSNQRYTFASGIDIDSKIFYSVPTSFFVIDSRIPPILRELITEAEGCVKMNFLTGASACTRKAIYELTILQGCTGVNYDERIKELKTRFPEIDSELFDVLGHIKDLTSDKVHEESWEKWDSGHLVLFIETLKVILNEIYVIPDERQKKSKFIQGLIPAVKAKSKPPAN